MVYMYNGIFLSNKISEFKSVLVRWMNLDPIIQSEVSQKKKNQYHILTRIYESRKMVLMTLFVGQRWRCRYREQACGHCRGRRLWDELTE